MTDEVRTEELHNRGEILSALECLGGSLFDQSVNERDTLSRLATKYADRAKVITVTSNGHLVGLSAFYDNNVVERRAYLSMLVVDSVVQRRGYGALLLHKVIQCCTESNMRRLELEVSRDNIVALRFYRRMGFTLQREHGLTLVYGMELNR